MLRCAFAFRQSERKSSCAAGLRGADRQFVVFCLFENLSGQAFNNVIEFLAIT
jgi:hypothetical protein